MWNCCLQSLLGEMFDSINFIWKKNHYYNVHQPPFSQHQGKILKICWRTENLLFQNLKIMILQQNNYQYK